MFAISAAQQACLNALHGYTPRIRLAVQDAAGTYHYLTGDYGGWDFLKSLTVQQNIDDPTLTHTSVFAREVYQWSLAPLLTQSPANLATYLNPTSGYSPLLDGARKLKVEFAIIPSGAQPAASDWVLLFEGYIDTIDPGQGPFSVQVTGRDLAARAQDTWIENERVYGLVPAAESTQGPLIWQPGMMATVGMQVLPTNLNGMFYQCTAVTTGVTGTAEPAWPVSGTVVDGGVTWTEEGACPFPGSGVAVETVMQSILADNGLSDTVVVPTSPGWLITVFKQERQSVLDGIRQLAQQIGWDLRYLYGSGVGKLTFYQPTRSSPPVLYTFPKGTVLGITQADIDISTIRNVVRVVYNNTSNLDASGNPTRAVVQVQDNVSIARYGRRFMEISEDLTSKIDTPAEATTLATACLNDLSEPLMNLSVDLPFFPFVELNDVYTFKADGLHFDADQMLAVVSIQHTFDATQNQMRTTLGLRGSPCSSYLAWHDVQSSGRGFAGAAQIGQNASHALVGLDGSVTCTGAATATGIRITPTFNRTKDSQWDGFEYHLSTSNASPPSSSTLQHVGKTQAHEVHGLNPTKQYYVTVVPIRRNASKLIRGQPLPWVAVTPGTVQPVHVLTDTCWTDRPPNADFSGFLGGNGAPPDQWTMANGTWGTDILQDASTVFDGNYALKFATNNAQINSQYFPVKAGRDYFLECAQRNSDGTSGIQITAFWYTAKGSSIGSSGGAMVPVPAANTWLSTALRITPLAGARFCQLAVLGSITTAGHTAWCAYARVNEVAAQEPWNLVGATGQPAFGTNFANLGTPWAVTAFYKGTDGTVHVKGNVHASAAQVSGATIFTLPAGYRPLEERQFTCNLFNGTNNIYFQINVLSSGAIQLGSGAMASGNNLGFEFSFLGEQ